MTAESVSIPPPAWKKVQDLIEVKKRFPEIPKKEPNIFILKSDPFFNRYKMIPLAQVFADIWNLPEWYAREYTNVLLSKIKGMLGL